MIILHKLKTDYDNLLKQKEKLSQPQPEEKKESIEPKEENEELNKLKEDYDKLKNDYNNLLNEKNKMRKKNNLDSSGRTFTFGEFNKTPIPALEQAPEPKEEKVEKKDDEDYNKLKEDYDKLTNKKINRKMTLIN